MQKFGILHKKCKLEKSSRHSNVRWRCTRFL